MTKQHILQEIKRIALANGGKAPCRDAFYNATSINESDWAKYWPRWSEAILEADLVPNQMKAGYEADFLIEKLIALAREVGRFPVRNDFRMKTYNEPGFPSDKTFFRLGSKKSTHFKSCRVLPTKKWI
jgi:hypothetical protein